MLSKYLQNKWIKSNIEVGWSAWLREVIELWLSGGLGCNHPLGLRCIFRTGIWRGLSVQHFPLKFVDLLQITSGGVRGVVMYGWQLTASHFTDKAREAQ